MANLKEKLERINEIANELQKNYLCDFSFEMCFMNAIIIEKSLIFEDIRNSIENIDSGIDNINDNIGAIAINLCEINLNQQ